MSRPDIDGTWSTFIYLACFSLSRGHSTFNKFKHPQSLFWPRVQSWLHFTMKSRASCTCLPGQLYTGTWGGLVSSSQLLSSVVAQHSAYHPRGIPSAQLSPRWSATAEPGPMQVPPQSGFSPETLAPFLPADIRGSLRR